MLDFEGVRRNPEKAYYEMRPEHEGWRMFLHHEAMISRFHFMLELACRRSGGQVEIDRFLQGAELRQSVTAPKLKFDRDQTREDDRWYELDEPERLPHCPDAFFTLRFPRGAAGGKLFHFFYEAERKRNWTPKVLKKFRAHFQFTAKQRLHQQPPYGVDSIRAVLVESTDMPWAEHLRQQAAHPMVSGPKPSTLFWLTASEFFTKPVQVQDGKSTRTLPLFLNHPEIVFARIWATPQTQEGDPLSSLLDEENIKVRATAPPVRRAQPVYS